MNVWSIQLNDEIIEKLADSIKQGPMINDSGMRKLDEKKIGEINGLKIEVFSNEHPPPHFKVTYQGESNDFSIKDGSPLYGQALKKWHKNIKKWYLENKKDVVKAWNENRPTDCPVGKYKED